MQHQRWIPLRLKLTDVQALLNGHQQIAAVVSALSKTNWAGAETAIAALAPLDQWIADLYNRCEPHWLKYLQSGNAIVTDAEVAEANAQSAEAPVVAESEPGPSS
jgi:hypothetical protein